MMLVKQFRRFARNKLEICLIYLFLFVVIIIAAFVDTKFLTSFNLRNLIVTLLPNILVAFAQIMVIITAGIDLSVGSVVTLSNVVCAVTMSDSAAGVFFAVILALLSGAAVGFTSGIIVAKARMQPLIVTLAMSTIAAGIALAVLPKPGGKMHAGFASLMGGRLAGFPTAFFLCILFTLFVWLLLNRTWFGQGLFAIGGNEFSAYSSGINVVRSKVVTYTLSGLLSATAGIFLATQIYSGDPTIGDSYTLLSITIAALGGTSLFGGKGSVMGIIAGAGVLVIINNILNLAGISKFYQFIIQGSILALALMLGALWNKKK
jgi:ribose/xylose/arabinose/galactoside ABC-type transport system permease subunit